MTEGQRSRILLATPGNDRGGAGPWELVLRASEGGGRKDGDFRGYARLVCLQGNQAMVDRLNALR